MKPPKLLSLNGAAKMAGKAKGTILKALSDGTLSGSKNAKGQWEIQPSELSRVYDFLPPDQSQSQSRKPTLTPEKTIETSVLEVELKFMREKLSERDATIDDLKAEKEDWKQQAQTLLIANQNTSEQAGQGARRGLWSRLFG